MPSIHASQTACTLGACGSGLPRGSAGTADRTRWRRARGTASRCVRVASTARESPAGRGDGRASSTPARPDFTSAVPMRKRWPMRTCASVRPLVVRFAEAAGHEAGGVLAGSGGASIRSARRVVQQRARTAVPAAVDWPVAVDAFGAENRQGAFSGSRKIAADLAFLGRAARRAGCGTGRTMRMPVSATGVLTAPSPAAWRRPAAGRRVSINSATTSARRRRAPSGRPKPAPLPISAEDSAGRGSGQTEARGHQAHGAAGAGRVRPRGRRRAPADHGEWLAPNSAPPPASAPKAFGSSSGSATPAASVARAAASANSVPRRRAITPHSRLRRDCRQPGDQPAGFGNECRQPPCAITGRKVALTE